MCLPKKNKLPGLPPPTCSHQPRPGPSPLVATVSTPSAAQAGIQQVLNKGWLNWVWSLQTPLTRVPGVWGLAYFSMGLAVRLGLASRLKPPTLPTAWGSRGRAGVAGGEQLDIHSPRLICKRGGRGGGGGPGRSTRPRVLGLLLGAARVGAPLPPQPSSQVTH